MAQRVYGSLVFTSALRAGKGHCERCGIEVHTRNPGTHLCKDCRGDKEYAQKIGYPRAPVPRDA